MKLAQLAIKEKWNLNQSAQLTLKYQQTANLEVHRKIIFYQFH
jgi:hypothetical protein